jgi:hypothetical protein
VGSIFTSSFASRNFCREPLRAALKVGGVLGFGADAGDAEKFLEAFEGLGALRFELL